MPGQHAACTAGIAIGGDVFPGSTLSDHCLRYQNIPDIKLIVVLGELGGHDEYSLVDALKSGKITKPVVAWVSGTCAKLFKSEVQFGHAGAKSGGASESAQVRSAALSGLHRGAGTGAGSGLSVRLSQGVRPWQLQQ